MRFMIFGVLALIAGFFSVKIINESTGEISAIKRDGIVTRALPISGYTESRGRRSGTTYHIDLKFKTATGSDGGKRISVSRNTLDRFASGSPVEVQYLAKDPSQAIILGDSSTEVNWFLKLFGYGFVFLGLYLIGKGYIDYKEEDSAPGGDVADLEALSSGRFYAGIGLACAMGTFFALAVSGKGVIGGVFLLACVVGTMAFGAMANSKVNAGYGKDGMTTPIALILLLFPLVALLPLAYLFLRPTLSIRHAAKFGAEIADASPLSAASTSGSNTVRTQTVNRTTSNNATTNTNGGAANNKAEQARMLILRALPQIKTALTQPMNNGEMLATAMEVQGVKIPVDDLPIVRVACKSLAVSYVVESSKGLTYINPKHLRDAGVTADQLHATAIENLMRLTKNPDKGLAVLPQEEFFGVMLDSKSEASLLLVDALWDGEFKADTRNGVVVALPAREMLAFADMRSTAGVAALRELNQRVAPSASKALTKQLYHRVDGDWVTYV